MSDLQIKILASEEYLKWNKFVDQSTDGTIFHQYHWLIAAEKQSGHQLIPLMVFQGDKLVCVFPLFYHLKKSLKILLSPPNNCGIPHLGPVITLNSTKSYKKEKTYFQLLDNILIYLKNQIGYDYLRINATPFLNDMRPFLWQRLSVSPNYTYYLPLSGIENKLFDNFDSRIRQQIRSAEKNEEIRIKELEPEEALSFIALIKQRYTDQGKSFKVKEEYFSNLLNSPLKSNFKFLAGYYNNKIVSGLVLLDYQKRLHHWLGAITPREKVVGINELLHWTAIKDYGTKGYFVYEFMGANTRHLCDNKSKYGPVLQVYYTIEDANLKAKIALKIFEKLK